MADALLFEPVPYRSALKEGCSHVIALRTRADDLSVTKKMGLIERMIMSRFFGRKLKMPHLREWMHNQFHKLLYAEDILRLNAANRDFSEDSRLFTIALPAGVKELSRTDTNRAEVFDSIRRGFAAAYDSLVLDPALRGRGYDVAKEIWPDSILDSAPPKG
jgi:hypothetical protein